MIDPSILDALLSAGATAEMIVAAVKADVAVSVRRCYVYMLIYPHTEVPFYIGISFDPVRRFKQHCNDPASACFELLSELDAHESILEIYRECESLESARDLESLLIKSTPGLLNRSR